MCDDRNQLEIGKSIVSGVFVHMVDLKPLGNRTISLLPHETRLVNSSIGGLIGAAMQDGDTIGALWIYRPSDLSQTRARLKIHGTDIFAIPEKPPVLRCA